MKLSALWNPALNQKIGSIYSYGNNPTPILQLILQILIDLVIGVGGIYFFFQLFIGGYNFLTAGGDKDAVQKAQLRIRNAVIGIVLILSVFAIVYIVETVFGIPIRLFTIPNV